MLTWSNHFVFVARMLLWFKKTQYRWQIITVISPGSEWWMKLSQIHPGYRFVPDDQSVEPNNCSWMCVITTAQVRQEQDVIGDQIRKVWSIKSWVRKRRWSLFLIQRLFTEKNNVYILFKVHVPDLSYEFHVTEKRRSRMMDCSLLLSAFITF